METCRYTEQKYQSGPVYNRRDDLSKVMRSRQELHGPKYAGGHPHSMSDNVGNVFYRRRLVCLFCSRLVVHPFNAETIADTVESSQVKSHNLLTFSAPPRVRIFVQIDLRRQSY